MGCCRPPRSEAAARGPYSAAGRAVPTPLCPPPRPSAPFRRRRRCLSPASQRPPPPSRSPSAAAAQAAAAASSSSPFLVHQQTMQDELLLGLTQQPARPLSGAAAAEKLPSQHPGGGTNAGVTHLLPSQDFKPSLHHPPSSSASRRRTSSPQDFSERQQQPPSSQKRKEFSPAQLPHPPELPSHPGRSRSCRSRPQSPSPQP